MEGGVVVLCMVDTTTKEEVLVMEVFMLGMVQVIIEAEKVGI